MKQAVLLVISFSHQGIKYSMFSEISDLMLSPHSRMLLLLPHSLVCDSVDCTPRGPSVHFIFQARILKHAWKFHEEYNNTQVLEVLSACTSLKGFQRNIVLD